MKYTDGQLVAVGDEVSLGGGMTGTVVCCLDDAAFTEGFSAEKWAGLGVGAVVKSPQAGLVYFAEPDVDFVLLRRAKPTSTCN